MIKEQNTEGHNPYVTTGGGNSKLVFEITDKNIGDIENVFSDLPSDISQIIIENLSKSRVNLNIPDSIGSLSNLELLYLNNCINSIPESICQLSNLRFLGLNNNKDLKTIPECINDMDSLLYLRLTGSDIKTPIKGINLGDGNWEMDEKPKVEKTKEEKIQDLQNEMQKIQQMIVKLQNS
jgi:hypothetical protein